MNIAHFPTLEEAASFKRRQEPFINFIRIDDSAELHPNEVDHLRFSVLYELKKKHDPLKAYALDNYGNLLPESV